MADNSNVAIIRRWLDEVWSKRSDATVRELLDPDGVGHLEGLVTRGVDEFLTARSYLLNAFPDFAVTPEDFISEGDHVAVRWCAQGTHRGNLMDIPGTGVTVKFSGLTWFTLRNGRIVEGWDVWNQGRVFAELKAAAEGRPSAGA